MFCGMLTENWKSHTIVACHELSGFVSALKSMDYKQAYYLPEYSAKLDETEALYQSAKGEYQEAAKNRLDLSDEEKKKYEKITHFSR